MKWWFISTKGERLVVRGNQRTLRLSHLGFEVNVNDITIIIIMFLIIVIIIVFIDHDCVLQDSGQFVCAAHNLVRGEERITQVD